MIKKWEDRFKEKGFFDWKDDLTFFVFNVNQDSDTKTSGLA